MTSSFKFVFDWRIWLIIVLIIILILWWIFNHNPEEFEGINLNDITHPKDNKPSSKPSNKSNTKKKGRMTSNGEELCRRILEQHYCRKFAPADHEPWLMNNKTGCTLKLDGYNRELGIAFEFNGRQHYEYTPHFHKNGPQDLIYQNQRDEYKKKCCRTNKVWLIIIPYYKAKTPTMCRQHILDQLPENIIS